MAIGCSQSDSENRPAFFLRRLHGFLARRAYSVIVFGALFCTLTVKFFHSYRNAALNEYISWIPADIAVLLGIEVILTAVYFRWPKRWVMRLVTVVAAIVCTWSVMNAGLLIRTGAQILPSNLLSLIRDPLNILRLIGVNLIKMPFTAVILLGPSAIALIFFFFVLARPQPLNYSRKHFVNKSLVSCIIIFIAVLVYNATAGWGSAEVAFEGLRYNCQLRAVTGFILPHPARLTRADLSSAERAIPTFDQLRIELPEKQPRVNHNVVVVVLEGVQYKYTSLGNKQDDLTPQLADLASDGVEFVSNYSSVTHTTKALFGFLTGRYPSVSHDIVEAVPAVKSYASIATILKEQLNFRTAFFQSARGDFEARPGLVYNLGFDKFWARDNLNDPNAYLGYLACDEFVMLQPIVEWIKADERPFFLTVLCSVTHDPYEIPEWFAAPAKEPLERYLQSIFYTDRFIAALDAEIDELNLTDKTIFCVIGDHGEAFGEHGLLGHDQIPFDEVVRVPWVMRAPFLIKPATRVTKTVSSVDLAPTLLALLGFEVETVGFDGINALGVIPDNRKVYFSGWVQQGPTGFIKNNNKFIYYPANKTVSVYDLNYDPYELTQIVLPEGYAQGIADEIIAWRKSSIFRPDQQRIGEQMLFDLWLCQWRNRNSKVTYNPETEN